MIQIKISFYSGNPSGGQDQIKKVQVPGHNGKMISSVTVEVDPKTTSMRDVIGNLKREGYVPSDAGFAARHSEEVRLRTSPRRLTNSPAASE